MWGLGLMGEAGRSFLEDDRWGVLLTVTPDAHPTTLNLGMSTSRCAPAPCSWVLTKEKVKLGGPDAADGGRRTRARMNLSRACFVPDPRLGACLPGRCLLLTLKMKAGGSGESE